MGSSQGFLPGRRCCVCFPCKCPLVKLAGDPCRTEVVRQGSLQPKLSGDNFFLGGVHRADSDPGESLQGYHLQIPETGAIETKFWTREVIRSPFYAYNTYILNRITKKERGLGFCFPGGSFIWALLSGRVLVDYWGGVHFVDHPSPLCPRDYLAHEPNLMSHFSVYVKTVHRAVSQVHPSRGSDQMFFSRLFILILTPPRTPAMVKCPRTNPYRRTPCVQAPRGVLRAATCHNWAVSF